MHIYLASLLVLIAVFLGHILGLQGLNVQMPALNIGLHILGGVGIALFFLGIIRTLARTGRIYSSWWALVGVLILGLIWEIIEVRFDVAGFPFGTAIYYSDTIKDILNGAFGALVTILFVRSIKSRAF